MPTNGVYILYHKILYKQSNSSILLLNMKALSLFSPAGLALLLAAKACIAWDIKFYSDSGCNNVILEDSGDDEKECTATNRDAWSAQFFPSEFGLGVELSGEEECGSPVAGLEGCKPAGENPWRSYEINRYA
jgi:hypothetical protein